MSKEAEHSILVATYLDNADSHTPTKVAFACQKELRSEKNRIIPQIVMDSGQDNNGRIYSIEYADPISGYSKPIKSAKGIFKIAPEGPVLIKSTVSYADGEIKTQGDFFFLLNEGAVVTDMETGKVMRFIEPIAPQPVYTEDYSI